MALLDSEITIEEFVKLTPNGVKIADFVQIRDAISKRYKEIYGQDIDISGATADGVFINDLSLIINNICQSIRTMYANLDINTATGTYLDNLCRLSNIVRKPATPSKAFIGLKNLSSSDIIISKSTEENGTTFSDAMGNEWLYSGQEIVLEANGAEYTNIEVKSSVNGKVIAPAGTINVAIGNLNIEVVQLEDAIVGSNEETDAELRARRNYSISSGGTTVVEGLLGALLELPYIEDAKVYVNNSDDDVQNFSKDGMTVGAHSIYVILRQTDATQSNINAEIANIIYEKLTPGISSADIEGTVQNGEIISQIYEPSDGHQAVYNLIVKWKKAEPVHPNIVINLQAYDTFVYKNETEEGYEQSFNALLVDRLVNYLNELPISKDLFASELIGEVMMADPTAQGRSSFYVSSVSISDSTDGKFTNKDTFYKYSAVKSEVLEGTKSGLTTPITITLKGDE